MCAREREREQRQLLTVIGSVLGGSDGIDESTESSDGSVDLENPGSHGL